MLPVSTHSPQRIIGREDLDGSKDRPWERGLGPWAKRNGYLLTRLFVVLVFTFGASTTAANFSYGLQGEPIRLTPAEIRAGQLPPGAQLGDYVEIRGTPDFSVNPETGQPRIGVSARYEVSYFYFELKETGDNLLIQQAETPPNVRNDGERVWRGQLQNVDTVIFHNTTQRGLNTAGLPHDGDIPVVETGATPEYYRTIFPAYAAIVGLWVLSIGWLAWRRNKPFLGL
jgi:hypothetical protein